MSPLLDHLAQTASFGPSEMLRIFLVAMAALNIGTIAGRVRSYWTTHHRLQKAGQIADLNTLRAVNVFYVGYLIVLASMAWRIVQLYGVPVTFPLVVLAFGLVLSFAGLRLMAKHVAPQILSEETIEHMVWHRDDKRRRSRKR